MSFLCELSSPFFFHDVFAILTYYRRLKHFFDERREKATKMQRMRKRDKHGMEKNIVIFGEERLINCDWCLAFLANTIKACSSPKISDMIQRQRQKQRQKQNIFVCFRGFQLLTCSADFQTQNVGLIDTCTKENAAYIFNPFFSVVIQLTIFVNKAHWPNSPDKS